MEVLEGADDVEEAVFDALAAAAFADAALADTALADTALADAALADAAIAEARLTLAACAFLRLSAAIDPPTPPPTAAPTTIKNKTTNSGQNIRGDSPHVLLPFSFADSPPPDPSVLLELFLCASPLWSSSETTIMGSWPSSTCSGALDPLSSASINDPTSKACNPSLGSELKA